ncbi:MAG: AlkA N-terminal domain-containing protein, partial [Pseudobdellovibrio sp.]
VICSAVNFDFCILSPLSWAYNPVIRKSQTLQFLGIRSRHLRRLFIQEVGKTPRQLILENKLNLARKLIVETAIPITDIAFSSGFNSIRRFNEAFKKRFKKAPREIRRGVLDINEGITLLLPYRPPFDYEGLLKNYEMHRIGDLEWFENGKMFRVICMNNQIGFIEVSHEPLKSSLKLKINFSDMAAIYSIVAKVRELFDLDSDPVLIANTLEKNSEIKRTLKKYEGIRLSSGWDAFETAVAVILGQLVSVERGRCLVRDLIHLTGTDVKIPIIERTFKLFPTPQQIMNANLTQLKTTNRRKETLKKFSRALIEGEITLEPTQDVNLFIKKVQTIKGIGPWTAQYMALKVLRDTDTFPESDLILARALKLHSKETIESMSPWRSYVASLFWRAYAVTLQKNRKDLG